MANRLELQSRALWREFPLTPIGITHKESTNTTAGYLPPEVLATLEVASTSERPLCFAFLETSPYTEMFFLVHSLQVGSSVLFDDPRGLPLTVFKSERVRLAPARLTKGEKIVLKVRNWDTAGHCFHAALFFADDET